MKKEQIVRKLTSRKFWLSVASFVSMLIIALGGAENTASQVAALIMAGATVIGYAIGEGLADKGSSNQMNGIEEAIPLEEIKDSSEEKLSRYYTFDTSRTPCPIKEIKDSNEEKEVSK